MSKDAASCFSYPDPTTQLCLLKNKMIGTLNFLAGLVSSPLQSHKRLTINALLTIDVHNRDIIISMIENKITRIDDFEWTRYLTISNYIKCILLL